MFRKKWEVYRLYPSSWNMGPDGPYCHMWTRRGAEKLAERNNAFLRNGRSDEEFAVFKVRRRP